jgi:hypothetical protein
MLYELQKLPVGPRNIYSWILVQKTFNKVQCYTSSILDLTSNKCSVQLFSGVRTPLPQEEEEEEEEEEDYRCQLHLVACNQRGEGRV